MPESLITNVTNGNKHAANTTPSVAPLPSRPCSGPPAVPAHLPIKPPATNYLRGPNNMVTAWVVMTPALVAACLTDEINCHNRRMQLRNIDRCTRDLNEDHWHLHHQGIAFDTLGRLADGQNRLQAIVDSGKTVQLMVTWNLAPEAQRALDTGKIRTAHDQLIIADIIISNRLVAVANLMHAGLGSSGRDKLNMTVAQRETFVRTYWDGLEFVKNHFVGSRTVKNYPASVLAPFARAFYTQDLRKLRQAIEVLCTRCIDSSKLGPEYKNMLVLIGRLDREGKSQRPPQTYANTEYALGSLLAGRAVKHIREATEELFALPTATELQALGMTPSRVALAPSALTKGLEDDDGDDD